jgi:hypothetical protein
VGRGKYAFFLYRAIEKDFSIALRLHRWASLYLLAVYDKLFLPGLELDSQRPLQ